MHLVADTDGIYKQEGLVCNQRFPRSFYVDLSAEHSSSSVGGWFRTRYPNHSTFKVIAFETDPYKNGVRGGRPSSWEWMAGCVGVCVWSSLRPLRRFRVSPRGFAPMSLGMPGYDLGSRLHAPLVRLGTAVALRPLPHLGGGVDSGRSTRGPGRCTLASHLCEYLVNIV